MLHLHVYYSIPSNSRVTSSTARKRTSIISAAKVPRVYESSTPATQLDKTYIPTRLSHELKTALIVVLKL